MLSNTLLTLLPSLTVLLGLTSATPITSPLQSRSTAAATTTTAVVKALHYGDYCLTVDNNGTPSSFDWESEAYLAPCSTGGVNQQWTVPNGGETGHIRFNDELCLDAGVNPGDGAKLKLWECLDLPQQIFTTDANHHFRLGAFDQCLDVRKESVSVKKGYHFFEKYRDLQTWTCSDTDPEQRE